MTLTNSRTGPGRNSHTVFTLSVADTNSHDLPDVDGDDSAGGDGWSTEGRRQRMAKVVNNQDQDLTADLEATTRDDPDFAEADTVVSGVTVSSGGGTETLVGDPDTAFDFYRVVVSFSTAPSGTSDTKVVFRANE